MSKNKVVIFTKNNARIIITNELSKYKKMQNAVINPDLSNVLQVAPQYWKLEGKKIVEMTRPEKMARDLDISLNGANNQLIELPRNRLRIRVASYNLVIISAFLLGTILGWALHG
jgi:hypothetical protein